MKKKVKEELKSKTAGELIAEVAQKNREILNRRLEIRTGKSKNTDLSRLLDNLAVIKTILQQRLYKETLK